MELIELAVKAVDYIKRRWELPNEGLLAGGALANTIWAMKSGKEPLINDVDVFVFVGHLDMIDPNDRETLFRYTEKEVEYYDDYNGYREHPYDKKFYAIKESTRDGMVNTITYDASDESAMLILESFDLSCTAVGYDLMTGEYHWTDDFEDFIENGRIRVSNIGTPSHTAIRLAKKSKDLGVEMDQFELKLLMHAIEFGFADTVKKYFKEKRKQDYDDVKDLLIEHLHIHRVPAVEDIIKKNHGLDEKIYGLRRHVQTEPFDVEEIKNHAESFEDIISQDTSVFKDGNVFRLITGKDFLNYMRNVHGDEVKMRLFRGIYPLFGTKNYFDTALDESDVKMLSVLSSVSPMVTKSLKGLTLSQQIAAVRKTFAAFEDKTVALALLESGRVVESWMDESDTLLMELSVRRDIFGRIESRVSTIGELLGRDTI
jgi:hypothetical protein